MSGYTGHGVESARVSGGRGHDLELMHAGGALPVDGAKAVRAGVAAADDDDLLALRVDRRQTVVVDHRIAVLHAVGPGQELHRLMDAVEVAAGDRQIAPRGRTAGQHHRVELGAQLLRGDVNADVHTRSEDWCPRTPSAQGAGRCGASPS